MNRLAFLAVLVPAQALAASVYLNGVLIDGVTDQEFTAVKKVVIDGSGNVHIDAPDYTIDKQPVAGKPETKQLEKKYVLVSESTNPGLLVKVTVNDWVRTIKEGEGPVMEDITSHLHPGDNQVRVEASGHGELGLALGEAKSSGEQTVVDDPQIAAHLAPGATRTFTLKVK